MCTLMGDEKIAKTYRIRPFIARLIENMAKKRKIPNGDMIEEMVLAYRPAGENSDKHNG